MALLLPVVVGMSVGFYSATCVLCAAGIGFRFDFVPVLRLFFLALLFWLFLNCALNIQRCSV